MDLLKACFILFLFYFFQPNHGANSPKSIITLERSELYCNNDSATNCSCNVRRRNRTSPYLLDLYIHISKPIGRNISVTFRSYEWKNNQYKESFIGFNKNLCDFLEADKWLQGMIKDFGNIPYKCPVEVGLYFLRNFRVTPSSFPSGFPASKWKFLYYFRTISTNSTIVQFSVYFKVEKNLFVKKQTKKI